MKSRVAFFLLASFMTPLLLPGCASIKLLPHSTNFTEIQWKSYQDIEEIYKSIKKDETEEQLKEKGLHPEIIPAEIISDIDIRNKYLPNESIKIDYLDEGVQKCIKAKSQCFGYEFNFEKTNEKRAGSFWLDTIGIKRKNITSGWKFRGRMLLITGRDNIARVVYIERPGGSPIIKKQTETTKPLGPLQSVGEEAIKIGISSSF